MIAKMVILFLFGTSLTSGQYWPRMAPHGAFIAPSKSTGCPSGPEMAPLICKFMQPNMGQFKPQLIAPTTYIAPLVVEKCDSPQLQMDIEMPAPAEEAKPLVIPQPPELPPMTIPKFPVPIMIEAPPAPLHEPYECVDIPIMPIVNIPAVPELPPFEIHELPQIAAEAKSSFNEELIPEITDNAIEYHPYLIPQPPELPVFVMPEIPIHVVEQEAPLAVAPCEQDEPISTPIPAAFESLAPLPDAPELPAFTMPELPIQMVKLPIVPSLEDQPIPASIPVHVEPLAHLPAAPELTAFTMPEFPIQILAQEVPIPITPCLEDEPILEPIPAHFESLAPLPAAPELPAFVMPVLPEQELPMPAAQSHDDFPTPIVAVSEYIEPIVPMPAAPELPPASLPKFAIRIEIPSPPVIIAELEPYTEEKAVPEPIIIPQPPKLPEIKLPEVPVRVAIEEPTPCEPSFVMPSPFYQKLFPSLITAYNEKPKEVQSILLPPMEGAYPTPCVYNLVMNHVVPNMLSNNFRPTENIEVQPAPFVPCS